MPEGLGLRRVEQADVEHFLRHHRETAPPDPEPSTAEAAFVERWRRQRSDPAMLIRTIVWDDAVAGYVARFEQAGTPSLGFRLGRAFQGRGIASAAVARFVATLERPLYARVAPDNHPSLRVLAKAGFREIAAGDEILLRLD